VTIDGYLAGLERRLPRTRRRRFLAEAEEHLRDAAARHAAGGLSWQAAERAAVRDFGPVEVVARRLAAEAAVYETRGAALIALGAAALFVFPLYVVPENTLPPAQWAAKPTDITVLQVVTVTFWLTAVALAATSAAFTWTRWSHHTAHALVATGAGVMGSVLISAALVARWFTAAPVTSSWPLLAAPAALACLGTCVAAAAWARHRRTLLVR